MRPHLVCITTRPAPTARKAANTADSALPRSGPVLVRGLGDVGSAVAYWLFTAGCAVALHDEAPQRVLRRGRTFADAAAEGFARLEGIGAQRLRDPEQVNDRLCRAPGIPVLCMPTDKALHAAGWIAVIDCRPHDAGLPEGSCALLAPTGGMFRTRMTIGARVLRGASVGTVGNTLLWAPQDGVLTGLLRDGTRVERDTPLAEIGPRGADAFGIAPVPRRIAEEVLAGLPDVSHQQVGR